MEKNSDHYVEVSGISQDHSKKDLRDYFSKYGIVTRVKFTSETEAYVCFKDSDLANRAYDDIVIIDEQVIQVSEPKPVIPNKRAIV